MRRILTVFAVWFALVAVFSPQTGSQEHRTTPQDGEYLGREPMTNLTPEEPSAAWFHENTLVIRNGEAILDKVPMVIQHGKKTYSASDGGFLTFRAKFLTESGQNSVAMRLCESDYLVFPVGKKDQYTEIKTYPVKLVARAIQIGDVEYRPAKIKKITLQRLLQSLRTEPLEKSAQP
jgi:hypothetical protein